MVKKLQLTHLRRDYESEPLNEVELDNNPITQFSVWFAEWLRCNPIEPTAFTLSTVTEQGLPDSRVVLLKDLWHDKFVFFTNYLSAKGRQITNNPHVALNFYWPELNRQVRVKGVAAVLPEYLSKKYFAARPFASQCSAYVSPQSQEITLEHLQHLLSAAEQRFASAPVPKPKHWGGYAVSANEIEFWQGQRGRLHDRIVYTCTAKTWHKIRLAP